jgi:ribosomal-protein-alanine N-acetyltransferase
MISIGDFNISPIQLEDAWSICNFAVANEDRLQQFFPKTLEQNLTPTLSKRFTELKSKQFNNKEEFLFTIKPNQSNEIAGLVYIKELDWEKKQGEFAYAIGYPYEGKGLTTNAVKALSKYAFSALGLQTLQIISHKSNIGSIKVAKNNGYSWVKTLIKEFTPPNSEPLDMELYELYNER